MQDQEQQPVLLVENLSISFDMYRQGMEKHTVEMVHKLSLTVNAGEIVAVVGASGSGKSLLAHAILGILPKNSRVEGRDISFIPQSVEYLDPLMKVGKQVIGAGSRKERKLRQEKMRQLFVRYQLEESVAKLYPYQLSGGMARRVLISGGVMNEAKLIVADEPTPGLQEELARETMKNIRELAGEGCGVLVITHDVDLALQMADRIAVFYEGSVVEAAPAEAFSGDGKRLYHPYSKAFLRALPQNDFF